MNPARPQLGISLLLSDRPEGILARISNDPEGRLSNNPMPETTLLNE